jgi:Mg2+/Co2+ transporter CorB
MKRGTDFHWIVEIVLISVVTSMVFSLISSEILDGAGYFVAFVLLFIFIVIGVLFDMLGVAVTSAQETPFHSMASHGEHGAKQAMLLVRKSERVASICNDVVGDISGIVSGATAAVIAGNLTKDFSINGILTQLLVTGTVAGLTIGGKAVGKSLAMTYDTQIVHFAGRLVAFCKGEKDRRKTKH